MDKFEKDFPIEAEGVDGGIYDEMYYYDQLNG